jgi:predicted GH43/DUF377 family glycosyl hydrolase
LLAAEGELVRGRRRTMLRLRGTVFHIFAACLLALALTLCASLPATPAHAHGPDGYTWTEDAGNPIFSGTTRAYYPRVLKVDGTYHMWYTDLVSGLYRCGHTTSADGLTWASPTIVTLGAGQPSHVVVVNIGSDTSPYYRIWYGDVTTWPYDDSCFRTAESSDGLTWMNDQAIGQDPSARLVQVPGSEWVYGSYGPGAVLYNPSGYESLNTSDPMGNKYVMYYDQYTYPGSATTEVTMLALSVDGINWSRWDNTPLPPVINASGGSAAWDAQYVYVWSVIEDSGTYHAWYSGGIYGSQEGIGYASSSDGLNWTKDAQPIMHISDAGVPSWRSSRTYTPCVLQEGTAYKMWYTGVGSGAYSVGFATALPTPTVASVAPTHGTQGQTLPVVLAGTNLSGATSVSFGADIAVNSFTVDSDTQITASVTISASAATGTRDVSVTAPGGTATLASGFTVNQGAADRWYEQFITGDGAGSGVYSGCWASQTFTPVTTHTLNTVSFRLYRAGSPTYAVTIGLYAAGMGDKPTGSALANTTFLASSLTTAAVWYEYQFPTGYAVTAGTKYALVLSATEGASGSMVYWRVNTAGTYGGGMKALSANQGTSWATFPAQDFMFREGQNPPKWYEQFTIGDSAASGIYTGFWTSQSFTPVATHSLDQVSLKLYRTGSPTYTVTIGLYEAGLDDKPTGPALASTTFSASSLTTTATWYDYQFSTGYAVTAGTKYALVLSATSGSAGTMVYWRVNAAGSYSRGMKAFSTNQGSIWTTVSAQDFMFKEGGHP